MAQKGHREVQHVVIVRTCSESEFDRLFFLVLLRDNEKRSVVILGVNLIFTAILVVLDEVGLR